MMEDDLQPRAATAPARVKRLTRSTLKRLTAIPPHKTQRNTRHYPIVPPVPGSNTGLQLRGLDDDQKPGAGGSDSEDEDPVEKLDANERRKRFLTMSNLKRVFRTLDLGEDGYIDTDELFEAQKRIGGKLSKQEVRDVIWEVDDNMTGRLSMNDYLTTYKRSHLDESGFEPKRFWSIVEFLLMDRDCSGEISLDEAMTTIFERQGADDLANVTKQFFEAAGVGAGEDPPPGATVTFMGYYLKVGRAKPSVPNKQDLRRSWSNTLRTRNGQELPPCSLDRPRSLDKSSSAGHLLPCLLSAKEAAVLAAKPRPRDRVIASPEPVSPKDKRRRRPATSPDVGGADGLGSPDSPPSSQKNNFVRGRTGRDMLAFRKPPGTGMIALEPLKETQGLASSALSFVGKKASLSDDVKEKATAALQGGRGSYEESAASEGLARSASESSLGRRPPPLFGGRSGGNQADFA